MGSVAKVIIGDCIEVLRGLPAGSVQCVVTSPPYWGLRDYKVEGQIGLEKTPEAYVAKMVEVFREVRRVLRNDGTCWINLGSSYASGGTSSSPSRLPERALACDSDGKELPDSQSAGRACPDSDDARRDEIPSHHAGTARSDQSVSRIEPHPSPTGRGSGPLDSRRASPFASHTDVAASTPQTSSSESSLNDAIQSRATGDQQEQQTLQNDVSASARKANDTCDTSEKLPTSAADTRDKESSFGACRDLSCKGQCGICFSYYAMRSLRVKPKDMVPIPWLVALALQSDGWWLRSDIIWHKPNPMPESVTDRPTKAHEYIFFLTKRAKYFYDAGAIKVPVADTSVARLLQPTLAQQAGSDRVPGKTNGPMKAVGETGTANKRSVWTVPTQGFPETHFATYPEDLITPCIKAGTSLKGCCPECGKCWQRIIEKERVETRPAKNNVNDDTGMANRDPERHVTTNKTTGWQAGCSCDGDWTGIVVSTPTVDTARCVVLDPFCGSGTTGVVALRHGCDFVGIELNQEYADMAKRRIEGDAPLFNWVETT